MTIRFSLTQLRASIGTRVRYGGHTYVVVEVLEDAPALVLKPLEDESVIQANQHGDAHRLAPRTHTIPVLSPQQHEFSAEFLALIPLD
ncbi:MAG: ATPase [Pseudomonadota bacterium]